MVVECFVLKEWDYLHKENYKRRNIIFYKKKWNLNDIILTKDIYVLERKGVVFYF